MQKALLIIGTVLALPWFTSGTAAQEVDIPPVELDTEAHRTVELVVVYLGATDCGPCRTEETKAAVRDIIERARGAAAERNLPFHAVGAALDEDWREGVAFLESTAEFDEIMSGGSWRNQAAVEHIFSVEGTVPGVPQLVIFTRASERTAASIAVGPKNELLRLVSGRRMRAWLDAGGKVFE